jgi:WD40 repeat protein
VGSLQAHEEPIRALLCWEEKDSAAKGKGKNFAMLATASKDQSVKLWSAAAGSVDFQLVATLQGHLSSVESLGRWESKNRLLSGDWAGNLYVWELSAVAERGAAASGKDAGAAKKKRKNSEGDVSAAAAAVELKALFTIKAHGQSVSGISSVDASDVVLTCSWDHSLKAWDLERQDCVSTMACSKVFTSLHRCPSSADPSAVLTSHPDGKVRLWDLRAGQEASGARATFGKTAQWMSQVMIATASCCVPPPY